MSIVLIMLLIIYTHYEFQFSVGKKTPAEYSNGYFIKTVTLGLQQEIVQRFAFVFN